MISLGESVLRSATSGAIFCADGSSCTKTRVVTDLQIISALNSVSTTVEKHSHVSDAGDCLLAGLPVEEPQHSAVRKARLYQRRVRRQPYAPVPLIREGYCGFQRPAPQCIP